MSRPHLFTSEHFCLPFLLLPPTDFPKQCIAHNKNQKVFVEMILHWLKKFNLNSFVEIETVKLSTFSGFSANKNLTVALSVIYWKFKLRDSPRLNVAKLIIMESFSILCSQIGLCL